MVKGDSRNVVSGAKCGASEPWRFLRENQGINLLLRLRPQNHGVYLNKKGKKPRNIFFRNRPCT